MRMMQKRKGNRKAARPEGPLPPSMGRHPGPQDRTHRILGMPPVPGRAVLPLHDAQKERRGSRPTDSTKAKSPRCDETLGKTPQRYAVTRTPDPDRGLLVPGQSGRTTPVTKSSSSSGTGLTNKTPNLGMG